MNASKKITIIIGISLFLNLVLFFLALSFWYQKNTISNKYNILLSKLDTLSQNGRDVQSYPGNTGLEYEMQQRLNDQNQMMNNIQNMFDEDSHNTYITGNSNMTYSSTFLINGKQLSYNLSQNGKKVTGQITCQDEELLNKIVEKLKQINIDAKSSDGKISLDTENIDINTIINTINGFGNGLSSPKNKHKDSGTGNTQQVQNLQQDNTGEGTAF